MKSKAKKWLIAGIIILVILAGVAAAVVLVPKMNQEPVYVYGFLDGTAGMTDYYEGGRESSGMVTTDRVQNVFLSETQTITEVLVTEGQEVKKGDVLCTYDTTLSDIALQKKLYAVEQAKLDLETAKQELRVINSYVPISYHPVETPEVEQPAQPDKEISELELEGLDYLVYSGEGTTTLTPKYCWLRSTAMLDNQIIRDLFSEHTADVLYIIFQHTEEDANDKPITDTFGVKLIRLKAGEGTVGEDDVPQTGTETYRISFYDPDKIGQTGPVDDGIDWNSGFTAAEIASMRKEKQAQIKQMEMDIKLSQAEYDIMCKEADSGQVVAQFDGFVVSVLDAESASMMGMPMLKVTGGGGYYVTGSVSELELPNIQVGQVVDVMSWDTGMQYEGTIVEIQDFPLEQEDGYYYYGGSQNVSYYPYKVFIDETAQLQDGYYVSMTLRGGEEQEQSLYIMNAFLRTEGATSYVYVRGTDGLLEKRTVRVGGTLWGSYTKILEGLTAEDYVAFPYGKQVKPGAPTAEGTWENLYGY